MAQETVVGPVFGVKDDETGQLVALAVTKPEVRAGRALFLFGSAEVPFCFFSGPGFLFKLARNKHPNSRLRRSTEFQELHAGLLTVNSPRSDSHG